ncbi:MAG: hypothetical protein A3D10_08340 [Omnitrophica WOR_2 bacterium RIFCSPHIGHO2_02_FULL_48_11]|nr:MAG: hypothetical protein A3D10_08340 [Omnitrophica WOR_2 bacterium RIFCSPHIGHO2_02_FULL_48_11]
MPIRYSVVIPAHNEAQNLPSLLEKIQQVLEKTGREFEIIVVNDNSTDNTKEVLEQLSRSVRNLKIICRNEHPGVGHTIREGLKKAQGEIIITMDGDLSHDPKKIPRLLERLDRFDMVCGSRYMPGGAAGMSLTRILLSGISNKIIKCLLRLPVSDSTSGFRVFKRKIIDTIVLKRGHFGIYLEILLKAYMEGFLITEEPITYHKRRYGKTKLIYWIQVWDYLRVIREITRLRLRKFFSSF